MIFVNIAERWSIVWYHPEAPLQLYTQLKLIVDGNKYIRYSDLLAYLSK